MHSSMSKDTTLINDLLKTLIKTSEIDAINDLFSKTPPNPELLYECLKWAVFHSRIPIIETLLLRLRDTLSIELKDRDKASYKIIILLIDLMEAMPVTRQSVEVHSWLYKNYKACMEACKANPAFAFPKDESRISIISEKILVMRLYIQIETGKTKLSDFLKEKYAGEFLPKLFIIACEYHQIDLMQSLLEHIESTFSQKYAERAKDAIINMLVGNLKIATENSNIEVYPWLITTLLKYMHSNHVNEMMGGLYNDIEYLVKIKSFDEHKHVHIYNAPEMPEVAIKKPYEIYQYIKEIIKYAFSGEFIVDDLYRDEFYNGLRKYISSQFLNQSLRHSFIAAIFQNNYESIKWIIEKNQVDGNILSSLQEDGDANAMIIDRALESCDTAIYGLLAKHGFVHPTYGPNKMTPFLIACSKGRTDLMKTLVNFSDGKCLQDKDNENHDAIYFAKQYETANQQIKNHTDKESNVVKSLSLLTIKHQQEERRRKGKNQGHAESAFTEIPLVRRKKSLEEELQSRIKKAIELCNQHKSIIEKAKMLSKDDSYYKLASNIIKLADLMKQYSQACMSFIERLNAVEDTKALDQLKLDILSINEPSEAALIENITIFKAKNKKQTTHTNKQVQNKSAQTHTHTPVGMPALSALNQIQPKTQTLSKNQRRKLATQAQSGSNKEKEALPSKTVKVIKHKEKINKEIRRQAAMSPATTEYNDKPDDRHENSMNVVVVKPEKEKEKEKGKEKEKEKSKEKSLSTRQQRLPRLFNLPKLPNEIAPSRENLVAAICYNLNELIKLHNKFWPEESESEPQNSVVQSEVDHLKCLLSAFVVCLYELNKNTEFSHYRTNTVHYLKYFDAKQTLCFLQLLITKCERSSLVEFNISGQSHFTFEKLNSIDLMEFFSIFKEKLQLADEDTKQDTYTLNESLMQEKHRESSLDDQHANGLLLIKLDRLISALNSLGEYHRELLNHVKSGYLTAEKMGRFIDCVGHDAYVSSLFHNILFQIYMIGDGTEIDSMIEVLKRVDNSSDIDGELIQESIILFNTHLALFRHTRNVSMHNPTNPLQAFLAETLNNLDQIMIEVRRIHQAIVVELKKNKTPLFEIRCL